MVSMKATTKTTKKQPAPRTEQELLAEIKKLAWELTDRRARNQVLMAVGQGEDWLNGKDS
jgi:hypothetical protein